MFMNLIFGNNLAWLPDLVLGIDILTALVIFYYVARYKYYWIGALELVQLAMVLGFEENYGHALVGSSPFLIDNFALIMLLIAGVIGGLIVVYSFGYMEEYQKEHPECADRRPFFFGVMIVFLLAMFGLVMSNNLIYMYTCWEVTSVTSFLLIGYTQTPEAIRNSFKALWMNLLGGLAFALAIVLMGFFFHTVELNRFLTFGSHNVLVQLVAGLLVFCGFTKCAMMPFSGWLLGAMVAPTPTSALLHSSTMVKAGVFLIIKLCPLMDHTPVGMMAMLVGGLTFFFAGCAAVSQSDGKRVLAYSTVSNLGLIVCCSGVGSAAAAWTAVMLVIFHAVAKSLCFLSVGTAEQQLGSRNLEVFDGLFCRLPHLAMCMLVGICGMFLAPFGMLISKWAAMKAVVDAGQPFLVLLLVFGSSITMFYWSKWIGKICIYVHDAELKEAGVHGVQWFTLFVLAAMVECACIGFPWLSSEVVLPYVAGVYHYAVAIISQNNLLIMSVMVLVVVTFAHGFRMFGGGKRVMTQLGGANCGDDLSFVGAAGAKVPVTLSNWYMEDLFGEKRMQCLGYSLCLATILLGLAYVLGGAYHV